MSKTENVSRRLEFESLEAFRTLCGVGEEHLKTLERATGVELATRGQSVSVQGERLTVELLCEALQQFYGIVETGHLLNADDMLRGVGFLERDSSARLDKIFLDTVPLAGNRRSIAAKSIRQKAYLDAIRLTDVTFGIGPAGTGKTYLAMAMAVHALQSRSVKRIVLTRPAVEAGEKLGFLPGDLVEKVNPYLRPLYDALHDMMDMDKAYKLIQRDTIEVAPLAFMRGRTLNDVFVVFDEAQNATRQQMKMFLTRLGYGSKAVITGDLTQVDLPEEKQSGLIHSVQLLKGIEGISIVEFHRSDVVRHPLVQRIVEAYEKEEKAHGTSRVERERKRRDAIRKAVAALEN